MLSLANMITVAEEEPPEHDVMHMKAKVIIQSSLAMIGKL
jgi:hypothetical protein